MATPRSRRRTVTFSVAGLITAVAIYQAGGVVDGVKGIAGGVLKPFSWTVNAIATPIGHVFAGVVNYSSVVHQNQELETEVGALRTQAGENAAAAQTLAQLETLLHLPFVGTAPTVVAQVVGGATTNFAATMTIDKGAANGVMNGMAVVGNGGLIGSVIQTTPHNAVVRLITDANSAVVVTFGAQSVTTLLSGRGANNALTVSNIPVTASLKVGETLVTSGAAGSELPSDIPVATVKSLAIAPGATSYSATVTPAANLSQTSYVDVVLWEPAA